MQQYLRRLKSALFACVFAASFTVTFISFRANQLIYTRQLVHGPQPDFDPNQANFPTSKLRYLWAKHTQNSMYASMSQRDENDNNCSNCVGDGRRVITNRRTLNWSQRNLIKRSSKSRYTAFDQVIGGEEFENLLDVLKVFVHLCDTHDLDFMLYGGSLLGAYRHFGLIPWDDDVDVLMKADDRSRIMSALQNVPGFVLDSPIAHQWKFYRKLSSRKPIVSLVSNTTSKSGINKKWPYVDIFFYMENVTHIWDDNRMYSDVYNYRKSDVFPLVYHPFEELILPVPNRIKAVLDKSYNTELCVTSVYSHKHERLSDKRQVSLPCKRLFPFYPFVLNSCDDGNVVKRLQLSEMVLSELVSDQSCSKR